MKEKMNSLRDCRNVAFKFLRIYIWKGLNSSLAITVYAIILLKKYNKNIRGSIHELFDKASNARLELNKDIH